MPGAPRSGRRGAGRLGHPGAGDLLAVAIAAVDLDLQVITAVTVSNVNTESKYFSAAIRPSLVSVGGQVAQQAGRMVGAPENGEPLSRQAAVTAGEPGTGDRGVGRPASITTVSPGSGGRYG
jgi:hypothetical protein